MSATDWTVIAAGVAAIVWVNWYFFVAGRSGGAAAELPERGNARNTAATSAPDSSSEQ